MTDPPTDRLALIESLLLQTAQSQRITQQQLDQLTLKMDQLSDAVEANTGAIASLTADHRASIEDLVGTATNATLQAAENSTFIKGLQVENRRILERLEQHLSNGHGTE